MIRRTKADHLERAILSTFRDDRPPRGARAAAVAAFTTGVAQAAASAGTATQLTGIGVSSSLTKVLVVVQWFGIGAIGGAAVLAPQHFATRPAVPIEAPAPPAEGPRKPLRSPPRPGVVVMPSAQDTEALQPASDIDPAATARKAATTDDFAPRLDFTPESSLAPSPKRTMSGTPRKVTGGARAGSPLAEVAPAASASEAEPPTIPPVESVARVVVPALGNEIRLLDETRQALSNEDAAIALGLLDRYDREFPVGTMKPEATVLRIESLVKAGNRAGATELAERSFPSLQDRYAQKVRLILSR